MSNGIILGGPGFEDTYECDLANGMHVTARSDKGRNYSSLTNEDRIVIVPDENVVGVIDGAGGEANAEQTAIMIAEAILNKPQDPGKAIEDIHLQLPGVAAILIAKFKGRMMDTIQAGDCRRAILSAITGKARESKDQTEAQRLIDKKQFTRQQLKGQNSNYVITNGVASYLWAPLRQRNLIGSGDRILLESDGLSENLLTKEIFEIKAATTRDLLELVWEITGERMTNWMRLQTLSKVKGRRGTFAPDGYDQPAKTDNRSGVIIDVP